MLVGGVGMIIMYERIDDKKEPFIETKRIQLGIVSSRLRLFLSLSLVISPQLILTFPIYPFSPTHLLLLPPHPLFTFTSLA